MNKVSEIIDDTIAALEEMKRTGVTHVEVSRETLEELGRKPARRPAPVRPAAPVPAQPAESERRPVGAPAKARPDTVEAENRALAGAPTADWSALEKEAKACVKCRELARCRTHVVFGVGNRQAELMFIGEAPGADEDAQGEPFVGRAGQLLTKIIEAMGLKREDVYIANVLKCRPPQNRPPLPDEVANCLPYLLRQIELIQPKAIVALGATALRSLLDIQTGISKMRGNWYLFHGVPIMPTFHPAYLLRNPSAKKEVWEDMKTVLVKLGREVPRRTKSE